MQKMHDNTHRVVSKWCANLKGAEKSLLASAWIHTKNILSRLQNIVVEALYLYGAHYGIIVLWELTASFTLLSSILFPSSGIHREMGQEVTRPCFRDNSIALQTCGQQLGKWGRSECSFNLNGVVVAGSSKNKFFLLNSTALWPNHLSVWKFQNTKSSVTCDLTSLLGLSRHNCLPYLHADVVVVACSHSTQSHAVITFSVISSSTGVLWKMQLFQATANGGARRC